MNKRNLKFIIALGFIALLGIITVQLHWIRSAYNQNKIQFEQSINKALNQIVTDISRQENIAFGFDRKERFHFIGNDPKLVHINDSSKKIYWKNKERQEMTTTVRTQSGNKKTNTVSNYKLISPSNQKIVVRATSNNQDLEVIQEIYLDSLEEHIQVENEMKASALALLKKDSLLKQFESKIDSFKEVLDYNVYTIASEKEALNKTMVELFMDIKSVTRPFSERVPIDQLQSSIQRAVKQYNLPEDYAFAIKEMDLDSLQYKTENFELDDIANAYSVQLFPHAFVPRPEFLYLAFPTSNPIIKQMIWPISLAFIFTLLLLLSLILIINSLLHHKKLSAIKTDFINNMTHEFKTPIATIQLATDSVMSDKIITQPEKISYFMGLIKGENKRMNDLVERILQMAQLEKKTFDLLKSEVDAHQLLEAVVENSDLKIKEAQGEIKLNLKAAKCNLHADEVHLTNVFFNLIDNAIKYKSQHLHLEISTEIKGKFLSILFKDNGIGMDKDTLAHIFDKFFRLTEGNIHTVKGYGLGLSYVKVIIEKHHGTIHVQSQLGLGSRFELLLPLKD